MLARDVVGEGGAGGRRELEACRIRSDVQGRVCWGVLSDGQRVEGRRESRAARGSIIVWYVCMDAQAVSLEFVRLLAGHTSCRCRVGRDQSPSVYGNNVGLSTEW